MFWEDKNGVNIIDLIFFFDDFYFVYGNFIMIDDEIICIRLIDLSNNFFYGFIGGVCFKILICF